MFNDNGSFLLAIFEFFIFLAWFMCLWWVFGDLFRSKDLGGFAKTLWVVFIVVLPFLGMFVYLIARGHGMTDRAVESEQQRQQQQADYIKSVAGSPGGTTTDEIATAKSLLDSGAITRQEFERIKAHALASDAA